MPLKFLGGSYAAYRHTRALIIVSPEPLRCGCLGILDAHKHVLIEPVISDCSVIAFNTGILLKITRLDKHQGNAVFLGPRRQGMVDIFRAIIAANRLGFVAPFNHLVKRSDDPYHQTWIAIYKTRRCSSRALGTVQVRACPPQPT